MKTKLLVYSILIASVSGVSLKAQVPYSSNVTYEMAASPLRSAPARQYNFSKAVMSDVMRLMAEDAGISFFGLPDGGDGSERMVTFTINAAPFTALETLAKANGVSLIHENGIWYLRPANDSELIGRIYEINYNAQELVRKNGQGSSTGGSSSGDSGSSSGGINLQGAPDFFEVEPSRLLEDIKGILDIQTTGAYANIAPTTSVDTIGQLSLRGLQTQPGIVASAPASASDSGDSQAKVIWNSDSNTLYVVASRQQHQWIEAYLSSADQEQTMIAVEIKFIETNKNPTCDSGIDWSGSLGDNSIGASLSDATGGIDLNNIGTYSLPTAVLSYSDLNVRLRSIYSDSRTKSVSYPRMVTLDNREVSFRSVVNQPVLASSASASLGAGATQTSSVEYIPVGTVINLLPKTMNDGKILLNVSVTVSEIVGTEVINGNPFPIASSRVYTAPLTVKSGYTVAISGLDAAKTSHIESGVPILGKLPVVGNAFKFRQKSRERQHLMMLITPVIINKCGVTKKPITKDPWCSPCAEAYPAKGVLTEGIPQKVKHPGAANNPARSRKSNLNFGTKRATVKETAYASAIPVNTVPTFANTNRTPVTPPVATPSPQRVSEPVRVKPPAQPEGPDPEIVKINERINNLRADLEKTPASDKDKINQVVDESKTLLSQIEAMRGSDSSSMTGELGDTWWSVIKLKTDAVKMSRE
ncbi:MAG: hypothetical protein P1V20_10120 [Verrucomicrobiales bacterium]|nr:hypothetical protein [Verrucomicrobiales bacterium]